MAIHRLNHAVLYVSDLERSVAFYRDVLGFTVKHALPGGAGALVGASDHGTTKSLYAKDPDGLEFEVVWVIPAHLLTSAAVEQGKAQILPLDLAKEKARYGAGTRGGLGVSVPLGVSV